VSDDVNVTLKRVSINEMPLDSCLKIVAEAAGLLMGKVGADTYLFLKAPKKRIPRYPSDH
jgi:hypothetical protein